LVNGEYGLGAIFPMELNVETEITCPHCGESFPLQVDTSQPDQSLIEDCTVCCRPIALTIQCRPGEIESVSESDA
jgi:Cysteine-rich CPXCG